MAEITGYIHPKADMIFLPSKAPADIEVGDEVSIRQASRTLGIDSEAVRGLIEAGLLSTVRGDDETIDGKSFSRFLGGLRAVSLVPKEKETAAKARLEVAEDADDADGSAWEADCPGCGERLLIDGGIHAFDCPSCHRRLTVGAPVEENPRPRRRHIRVHRL